MAYLWVDVKVLDTLSKVGDSLKGKRGETK
jgi:hypothetical protein